MNRYNLKSVVRFPAIKVGQTWRSKKYPTEAIDILDKGHMERGNQVWLIYFSEAELIHNPSRISLTDVSIYLGYTLDKSVPLKTYE